MNQVKPTTLGTRIRAAIRAFKGEPIGSLTFGIDIKKCSECNHKNTPNLPDFHDFDVGTDHNGHYFLCLHNMNYDEPATDEDIQALGVFTLKQVETLISNLRYVIGEEDDE